MTSAAVPDHPWLLPGALADVASSGARPRRTARDWLVDVHLFLFALGWAVSVAWDARQPDPELAGRLPYEWLQDLDTVLGLLACAALWLRRRWPFGLAVAILPLGLFSATAGVVLVAIMFTVVVHRPLSQIALVFGGSALTSVSYAMLRPDPVIGFWGELAWAAVFTGSVLAWGMFVRARRQLILSLRDRADRAEAEQQLRVAQARQLERTRIAREMHDVLAHRISLLSLHAGALEFRPDAPPEEVARAAGVIRESAHAALQDLREVIGVLRADDPPPPGPASSGQVPAGSARPGPAPAPAARSATTPQPAAVERPQPTLADVPTLVAESRAAGMRVEVVDTVEAAGTAPVALGRGAYRIVQEGLTNARKHAPGAAATVRLSGAPGDGLTVDVRNRWPVGAGWQPVIPGTGTGLVGVAERVSLAGGHLEHGRDGSGDFRLTAWLPWPA
ncbi:sensor histidine kinase [Micromonospora rubida]|uniref:sensor histidine kinase n=1 Tax=Micromonospora rubida TaxID=2697657 RepID=UPI00137828A8|nr:histidine kinase [Micromonospora rubida]NBE81682.1 sensor histidine kinase [Micromonospora rubida]